MHCVARDVIHLHRQKRAGPDVKRHGVKADAARLQLAHQAFREMQAGGRRRHGALLAGEHGLIIGAVACIGRPTRRDVGRQRQLAALRNGLVQHRPVKCERQRHLACLALRLNGGVELAEEAHTALRLLLAKPHDVARLELAGGLDQRLPARAVKPLDQRRFDPRLARAADAPA